MATPNYIDERIPKKFKLSQNADLRNLREIYEMIGENEIFPQNNDDLKRIRNSLRILKRSELPSIPDDAFNDLPMNLAMKFYLRAVKRSEPPIPDDVFYDLPMNLGMKFFYLP